MVNARVELRLSSRGGQGFLYQLAGRIAKLANDFLNEEKGRIGV